MAKYDPKEIRRLYKERQRRYKKIKSFEDVFTKEEKEIAYLIKSIDESGITTKEKKELKKKLFGFKPFYERPATGKRPGTPEEQMKVLLKHYKKLKPEKRIELKARVEAKAEAHIKREIEESVEERKTERWSSDKSRAGRARTDRQFGDYKDDFIDDVLEGKTEGMSQKNIEALLKSPKFKRQVLKRALKNKQGIEKFRTAVRNLRNQLPTDND